VTSNVCLSCHSLLISGIAGVSYYLGKSEGFQGCGDVTPALKD
jgi:hypothetical protein